MAETAPRDRQRAAPAKKEPVPDSFTVQLRKPIMIENVMTDKMVLRCPTVRDRMNVSRAYPQATQDERELYVVANLCGWSSEEVEQLFIGDWNAVQDALGSFIDTRP